MAEPAKHRVIERGFVPGAVVAAAVDEEGWGEFHTAGAGAGDVLVHLAPGALARLSLFGQTEIGADRAQIVLGQCSRA